MPSFDPDQQIPDLTGKVIFITGGNNGLGRETVLQLAKHNPSEIYLAARSEAKAREAIESINSSLHSAIKITYIGLDLTSLQSVREAASRFQSLSSRLDILILNAGIMATPMSKTEAGFEIQMGTNHFGHFLLCQCLLPILERTAASGPDADVRIITVSSEANNMSPSFETMVDTSALSQKGPWTRYGASKAANIYFATELARRYPQLTSVSLHPGYIRTDLYSSQDQGGGLLAKLILMVTQPLLFTDVPTGALCQLWAAVGARKGELENGAYYGSIGRTARVFMWTRRPDPAKAARFWEWTEAELSRAEKEGY